MKYLVTGITGQDGIHLTNLILQKDKNCDILGITRSLKNNIFFKNLNHLNKEFDKNKINLNAINLNDSTEVKKLVDGYKPDFIFNLSGPSSVYGSYVTPEESYNSILNIFTNLTNACIDSNNFSNFFQPSSSEMFKDGITSKLDENCKFSPLSPYAKAKLKAHERVAQLRNIYDWNISSGILFNHESEYRKDEYLFMKIINNAILIKNGSNTQLEVGSLDLIRDWSYAKDIAEAIFIVTSGEYKSDYVIGSGSGHSIKDLVKKVFGYFDLDYTQYIQIDKSLLRENTPNTIIANPEKIKNETGWATKTTFNELIDICIKFKIKNLE
tara:strand:+ start:3803 stop:4780 length:978 start_codon:yes stop_codon:yes gene_type:complete